MYHLRTLLSWVNCLKSPVLEEVFIREDVQFVQDGLVPVEFFFLFFFCTVLIVSKVLHLFSKPIIYNKICIYIDTSQNAVIRTYYHKEYTLYTESLYIHILSTLYILSVLLYC